MVDAKTAAAAFREQHDLGFAPIRDVIQVTEDCHAAWVIQMPLPAGLEARTVQSDRLDRTIVCVATTENPERQRFTLAHELGHLESGTLHASHDPAQRHEEDWANTFARNLLLPTDGLRRLLAEVESGEDRTAERMLSDVVRVFGVSPAVALIQLRSAGLINPALYRSLDGAWSSGRLAMWFGWQTERESAVRASLARRAPVAIVAAATKAYVAGKTSLESLAAAAGALDLDGWERLLEDNGIRPPQADEQEPERGTGEDFSDLFGEEG